MIRKLIPLCAAVVALSPVLTLTAFAEADKVEAVLDLLHQAETSSDPAPLLEKAKDEMAKFNAKPSLPRVNGRLRAGADHAAEEHKSEAVHAIEKAIKTAKATPATPLPSSSSAPKLGSAMDQPAGMDLKAEIENAVAKVHLAGEAKR